MITIELPFPPSVLNPNDKSFWRVKSDARAAHKSACYKIAIQQLKSLDSPEEKIPLTITFVLPDKRRRDADNLLAACKGLIDGVAAAWGIDDKYFKPITVNLADEPFKGGKVIVTIQPLTAGL